jgi:hypothetical protein
MSPIRRSRSASTCSSRSVSAGGVAPASLAVVSCSPDSAPTGSPASARGSAVSPAAVAQHPRIDDPAAQKVGEQPMQSVPLTGRADGVHEQVRCGEVEERRGAAAATGQCVGEVGGHHVRDADPHEQLRGQPVDHFIQRVRGHGMVVAGERVDEAGGVRCRPAVPGRQPQPSGPPLGPLDEPADVQGPADGFPARLARPGRRPAGGLHHPGYRPTRGGGQGPDRQRAAPRPRSAAGGAEVRERQGGHGRRGRAYAGGSSCLSAQRCRCHWPVGGMGRRRASLVVVPVITWRARSKWHCGGRLGTSTQLVGRSKRGNLRHPQCTISTNQGSQLFIYIKMIL